MKNKQTQFEKNLVKNAEKIMQWMEESGQVELQRKLIDAFYKSTGMWDGKPIAPDPVDSWSPETIKKHEYWKKNVRPKWKASKKIQNILDDFLNFPPDGREYNDILLEIGKIVDSERDKIRTKDPVDGGISYKEKKKLLDALDKYEKLVVGGMKPLTAKNKVRRLKKFDWSLGTLKKYLTKARKLRQQP